MGRCGACSQPARPEPRTEVSPAHALQALSTAGQLNTLTWVPRRLRSAAGQVLARLLHTAAACATLPQSEDSDLAHLRLLHAPQLLFRIPPRTCDQADDQLDDPEVRDDSSTTNQRIQERLQAASDGESALLIQMLWDDIEARDSELSQKPPLRASTSIELDVQADHATLPQGVLERAAMKARSGAVRAAANLLTGLPPVKPSQELNQAVATLFRTKPGSSEEEDRLQAALTAARALPANQRARLIPTRAVR